MRSSEHNKTTLRHFAEPPATQPNSTADISFRSLIDAAPDAIVLVSRVGLITLINRQTEALFGYTPDELLGQPVEILLPTRVHGIHQDHRARYVADPHTRPMGVGRELVARCKDATEFPVEISLSVVEVAGDMLIISIIRDVSAQKDMEAHRQLLLEREHAARALAEAAVRTRDELLAIIFHDLNNPLAVIKGRTQLLLRHLATAGTAVDGQIAHSLQMIDAQATQMTALIEALQAREKARLKRFKKARSTASPPRSIRSAVRRRATSASSSSK